MLYYAMLCHISYGGSCQSQARQAAIEEFFERTGMAFASAFSTTFTGVLAKGELWRFVTKSG